MNLAERMKTWPLLAAHQLEEIKAVLLKFEERLTALEPKKEELKVEEVKPTILTPHVHEAELPMVRLGPTPSLSDNPFDGTNLKS